MPELVDSASRRQGHLLATRHVVAPPPLRPRQLARRLRALERDFETLFRRLPEGDEEPARERLPAGGLEWLQDNDFVLGEALEALEGALPPSFLSRLPGLREPVSQAGLARVEALARELVEREEGQVELDGVMSFLEGYQEVRPLRLAELWALPSFLRIALLEELLATLTGEGRIAEVAPFILSLRTLAGEDWREVVESLSRVEATLSKDPAGVHAAMDFRTRDRYRREVEEIGHRIKLEEDIVARRALELARSRSPESREGHVGYYLVDEGRATLVQELGGRPGSSDVPRRQSRVAGWIYFGGIGLTTVLLLAALWLALPGLGTAIPLLLLAVIPAVGTAVALANWISGQIVSPHPLPRLDLRSGIPEALRTVVAVPSLLSSTEDIRNLLHTLETNYLSNPDPHLRYALLTDFLDAPSQRTDEDDPLLAQAIKGIRRLNARYGDHLHDPFLLIHRARRWNPMETRWMGWERKRGKLTELNRLLLGQPSELWIAEGSPELLEGTRFVITLDADTLLPRDAAAKLVGILGHPLNHPELGRGGRLLRGYTIVQPRIEVLPDDHGGTLFSRLFGGIHGLDLYAHAAFDVYQDLFGIGIFAGKGIYDVRAFESSLAGRIPENSLLSHDLFEGAHGRVALASDVVLLEDFPDHPLAYVQRAHRWIRGDWQLFPWLFGKVPVEGEHQAPNELSPLSRWMIVDNLRRSIQGPAILALLVLGWAWLPHLAGWWTFVLALVVGLPFITGILDAVVRAVRKPPRREDVRVEVRGFGRAIARWALELAFLPLLAWTTLDATGRTLARLYGNRRGLLEWTSAAVTARSVKRADSLLTAARRMRAGPIFAVATGLGLILLSGEVAGITVLLLILWVSSPAVGYAISRPPRRRLEPPGQFPPDEARLLARRIWGYYERFQGPDGHWLAPDHFQEEPGGKIAYRTSPTNLAMALVSTVTAWDLGFVGTSRFVTLIGNKTDGMRRLTRYRGHFLNWYSTSTLAPLHPQYVSTVDSGNLALALLATREALRGAHDKPLFAEDRVHGVRDTVCVVRDLLRQEVVDGRTQALLVSVRELESWIRGPLLGARREGLDQYARLLAELRDKRLPVIEGHLLRMDSPAEPGDAADTWSAVRAWLGHLRSHVEHAFDEVLLFIPWLAPAHCETDEGVRIGRAFVEAHGEVPTLASVTTFLQEMRAGTSAEASTGGSSQSRLDEALQRSSDLIALLSEDLERLDRQLDQWFLEMDFGFLYDERRELFRIGFSVSSGEPDPNHYDLLASEARMASAVALAKGEAPSAHWLHLARPYTRTENGPALLSWAGTMFEYLMPNLLLRMPPLTVLDAACRRAVQVQRRYARDRGIPWGISESGYHVLSPEGDYQYRAFGVPILGLRRNSGERLVVAPYASLMAVALAPGAVHQNLDHLVALGALGPWGPYEALDFGPESRRADPPRVVRSYMSHHQGMILAALGNHLTDHRLVERLRRDPRIATVEPYLHERLPWRLAMERRWVDRSLPPSATRSGPGLQRWSPPVNRLPPPTHHIASGDLTVSIGADGRGGTRWREWSIVRGSVGAGHVRGGPDLVLMDRGSGISWTPLPNPTAGRGEEQEVTFEPHRAEFIRMTRGIRSRMEVLLPPRDGVELREFSIANESGEPRHLRLALAVEIALAPFEGDIRHPAFHKLFVQAQALPEEEGLLFERRARDLQAAPPMVLATLFDLEGRIPDLVWETSREAFFGRLGRRDRPAAIDDPGRLQSPRQPHHPLDPVAAAVIDLDLAAWEHRNFTLVLSVGEDRSAVVRNAAEFRSPRRREWARIQAAARVEGELLRLKANHTDPATWEELLAHVLHPRAANRLAAGPESEVDLRQSSLWRWGISGDVPFILVDDVGERGLGIVADLVRAQRWWNRRGQIVDLVIVDRAPGEYQAPVKDRVRTLLSEAGVESELGRPGGVHLIRGHDIHEEERFRLGALAAFRVDATRGSLRSQLEIARPASTPLPSRTVAFGRGALVDPAVAARKEGGPPRSAPPLANPGGFDPDGGAYSLQLGPGETTPAPWVNVIAEDRLGFLVTEAGGSFTWLEDAGEFRITPWHNDPVLGLRGEVIYLRDEEDGDVWTPTPGPLGRWRRHDIKHEWGRSSIAASGPELEEHVSWSIHPDIPVKIVCVRLVNRESRTRRITATYFLDWVLGSHPARTAERLHVRFDSGLGSILARNPFSLDFPERIGFLASDGVPSGMAVDRHEFLSTAGPLDRVPAGLSRVQLGERITPAGEGCAALQREVRLGPGEQVEISFYVGAAESPSELRSWMDQLRAGAPDRQLLTVPAERWKEYLGRVRVRTPDPELNELMNGWLPYQTISSRLRGRTGFYQSGGAFGFRDQLQDVYTLLPLDPTLAANHLEQAARRQFREGDVLHWWHPGTNRGVKTRCSDDLLWLPFVLGHTVRWTGDLDLLERQVPFLDAPPLDEGVDERYDAFAVSSEEASLWEHALRAIWRTADLLSPRGLPLIGIGDWNDGMDRVGRGGKGESVWLGWFLVDICRLLLPLAEARGEVGTARRLQELSERVLSAIENHGWDGQWYRRAFFDDGTPLGSRDSPEARIDSLAQSWAVISQAADPERAALALDSAWRELVKEDDGIVLLLSPPFTGAGPDPGYIASYPPGVRENGGQYTHAAAWLLRAVARSGQGDRVGRLLDLLLPPRHTATPEGLQRYRVEPYVIAADVYGAEPHVGRGGWTWYTGSAGWLWRVVLEDVLGVRREGTTLRISPCIPPDWDGFEVSILVDGTPVEIRVENPDKAGNGVRRCAVEGREVDSERIPLSLDGNGRPSPGAGMDGSEPIRIEVVLGR